MKRGALSCLADDTSDHIRMVLRTLIEKPKLARAFAKPNNFQSKAIPHTTLFLLQQIGFKATTECSLLLDYGTNRLD
eukprot:scaffold127447_cov20-Prasinocladus_malaysianus.AAC.2